MLRSPYFDDLKLGDRFKTPGVTITDEAIIDFSLKYDPQYFHMDREAATNSIFGGLVASGFQIIALAFRLVFDSGLLVHNLGGNAADEVRWVKTVKAMDTIRVVAEVVELKPLASKPDRGMVKFKYIVTNQADEVVTTFILTQFMKRNVEPAKA
jgi:acyl dehydratase